jgi:beta-lactamase class A
MASGWGRGPTRDQSAGFEAQRDFIEQCATQVAHREVAGGPTFGRLDARPDPMTPSAPAAGHHQQCFNQDCHQEAGFNRQVPLAMKTALAALSMLLTMPMLQPAHASESRIVETARQVEADLHARVGLAVLDTGSGESWQYRAGERFPMVSTFKALACGALLARADAGEEDTGRLVEIRQGDLVSHAPVTEGRVGERMSLHALCDATMRTSDNTAANKVLDALGGPQAVTRFARSLGDETTRLDRRETELNEGAPGDPRDTTSPGAMAETLRRLVLGDALSPASRAQLTQWLVSNEVGGPLLRAGIPGDWRIGDRTGAGGHGTRGVVAVIWAPIRPPLVAAIYITGTGASMDRRNAAIAKLGEALAATAEGPER